MRQQGQIYCACGKPFAPGFKRRTQCWECTNTPELCKATEDVKIEKETTEYSPSAAESTSLVAAIKNFLFKGGKIKHYAGGISPGALHYTKTKYEAIDQIAIDER
jgi:hypothetical protein